MARSVATPTWILESDAVVPQLARDVRLSTFPKGSPKDLVYNDILRAPTGLRMWNETIADNGNTFGPNSGKFTITLKGPEIHDNAYAMLFFRASCSASDSSAVFFQNLISCLFSKIRVIIGGVVITDNPERNVLEGLIYAMARASNFDTSIGFKMMGIGSIEQRQAAAAGQTYAIPIPIPVLTAEEWVMARAKGGVVIEFHLALAQAVVCAVPGTTSPTATYNYTITDPRIRNHVVAYEEKLVEAMNAIPTINYLFENYKAYTPIIAAGSGSFQYQIPAKVSSLSRIIAFLRPAADVGNPFVQDVFTTDFQQAGVLNYKLKLGSGYVPPLPISCGGATGPEPAYIEAMICLNKAEVARLNNIRDQNNGTFVMKNWDRFVPNIDDFTRNRFTMCIDLKSTADNDVNYISTLDTTPGNVSLLFDIQFSPGFPTVPMVLYLFCMHAAVATLDTAGNVFYDE